MAVALLSACTWTFAASGTLAQTQPKMQMSTDIPAGIAVPDSVETRFGRLKFFDGFPDEQTVEKVYDHLDFQRAVQAYLLALAPVNMAGLREGLLSVGPANVTIPTFEDNMNARSIFLTANATTPYTWVWIDRGGLLRIPNHSIADVLGKAERAIATENLVRKAILEGHRPAGSYGKF